MIPIEEMRKEMLFLAARSATSPSHLSDNFRKTERQLLNLLIAKEYQKLEAILSLIPSQTKESFFERHGFSILHYAATSSNEINALKLIIKNIPEDVIRVLLRHNDFEILKDLIALIDSLENYLIPGQTEAAAASALELTYQKFNFLVEIAQRELLSDFLEKHEEERCLPDSIKRIVQSAVAASQGGEAEGGKYRFDCR